MKALSETAKNRGEVPIIGEEPLMKANLTMTASRASGHSK